MIAKFYDTRLDPITNRELALPCWDGRHQEGDGYDGRSVVDKDNCKRVECHCMCHDDHAIQLTSV